MVQLRFRYYDASGKERYVDAPEALADAAQKGQIGPTTLIWDALEGGWVRADEHDATHLAIATRLALGYDPKDDLAGRGPRGTARHDSGKRRPLPGAESSAKRVLRRALTLVAIGVGAFITYEILALIAV
jgi:hypothetical protein